jgi:hypothetical protein
VDFDGPYLQAMRDQAPAMFNQLRRSGGMEEHLSQKRQEAKRLFEDLTRDAPKLPNGLPEDPYRGQAERQVLELLIEFPTAPESPTTE